LDNAEGLIILSGLHGFHLSPPCKTVLPTYPPSARIKHLFIDVSGQGTMRTLLRPGKGEVICNVIVILADN
jgi:hypothetical protein